MHWCADWVPTRLAERAPRTDVGGTVLSTRTDSLRSIKHLWRTVRVVAVSRMGHYDIDPPPEDGELQRHLASLADFEWLVIDGWRRRRQRCTRRLCTTHRTRVSSTGRVATRY